MKEYYLVIDDFEYVDMEIFLGEDFWDYFIGLLVCVNISISSIENDGCKFYFFSSLIWISDEYCFLCFKDDIFLYFLSYLINVSEWDVEVCIICEDVLC